MSGTLSVVATPIGNLEDITLRALRVLREAQLIAAEDTRRTAKLLNHYGIETPTLSFHAHNSRARMPQLMARLRAGAHVALVTDAGTPGLSDPGAELVTACRDEDIAVDPLPGASAALVAAVGSGFPLSPLTFLGFPPIKAKARAEWLSHLAASPSTVVFFEAPHRIAQMLQALALCLGDRQICVGRELTKAHQEFVRGPANDAKFTSITQRGEFSIVVGPRLDSPGAFNELSDSAIAEHFRSLDSGGGVAGRRRLIGEVARHFGLTPNEVYQAIERTKV